MFVVVFFRSVAFHDSFASEVGESLSAKFCVTVEPEIEIGRSVCDSVVHAARTVTVFDACQFEATLVNEV